MGIFATGTLPSGVQVSNVYISFNDETIYVRPGISGNIEYTTYYKVFADSSKQGDFFIRVPLFLSIPKEQDTKRVFDLIYDHIKTLWPGSTDVIETGDPKSIELEKNVSP